VVEADESDKSHLNFSSLFAAVALNVDEDHLGTYGSFSELVDTFRLFLQQSSGLRVVCGDDPYLAELSESIDNVIRYGLGAHCHIRAENIMQSTSFMTFDVLVGNDRWEKLQLNLLGQHNVLNALSVLVVARSLGISEAIIRKAFKEFPGVKRRMTITGRAMGAVFIDDYAHHPTEIKAVLKTLSRTGNKVIAVCQPHRYTRMHDCFQEFVHCFQDADAIVLLPVYSAGEAFIPGATSHHLYDVLKSIHAPVLLCEEATSEALCRTLQPLMEEGAQIVFMGAGNITDLAYELPAFIEASCKVCA
jgi:UDP-N-acetylmuramate--alanine ligase